MCNNTINITCGIYNTEARITRHKDGTCTVRLPEISWEGNTGTLAFFRVLLIGRAAEIAKEMFDNNRLWNHDNDNLYDLCRGNYYHVPRPIFNNIDARRQLSSHGCRKHSIQLFSRRTGKLVLDHSYYN